MATLTDPLAIKANRMGEVTPDQRKALLSSVNAGYFGCAAAAVVMIAIVALAGDWLSQHEVVGWVVMIAVLIGSFLIVGRIMSIPMRQRLNHAQAQAVSGEVVWKGSDYAPVANGHTLKPIFTLDKTLAPGHYTFFCLENTRWLLSAEMTQTSTVNASPISADVGGFSDVPPTGNFTADELRRALAATKEFHPDAIDANRDGHMSFGQRSALLRDSIGTLLLVVLLFGVAVFMGIRATQGGGDMGKTLLAGGFFLLIGVFVLSNALQHLRDALGGYVEIVSGKGRKFTEHHRHQRGRNQILYFYEVGSMRFGVSIPAYNALIEGVVYRAYYAPHTRQLMNIEPDA